MARNVTRADFLADGARVCLGLAAGGVLAAGCARVSSVDADKARPAGAPKNFLAKEEDVRPVYYFFKGKVKGILVRTEKGIVGYVNRCTHMGGPTVLREKNLVCLWHGSTYDPVTGSVLKGPAKKPLPPLKLEVKDGLVLLAGS